VITNATEEAVG